jgi:hypothetical protein
VILPTLTNAPIVFESAGQLIPSPPGNTARRLRTWTYGHRKGVPLHSFAMAKGRTGSSSRFELLQGTLKAKFYAITATGKRQLAREVEAWDQLAGPVARLRGAD